MRALWLSLSVFGAVMVTAQQTAEPPAKLAPVESRACLTISPDQPAGYQLTNSCSACRTALISWCDGVGHEFDVPGQGRTHVPACPGMQSLVSDVPCQHDHG